MSQPSRFRLLVREVRRRSLWQVLGIYMAGAWAVLQVVDQFVERLALPEWTYAFALLLLIVGLPIVLAVAFVQEGGPGHSSESPGDDESAASAASAAAPDAAPVPVPASGARRRRSGLLTWRNAGVGGVMALAVWGLIAAGWLALAPQPRPGMGEDPGLASTRLAVLPFAVRGAGEYAYLREGLVDLLSTKLDGAGDLRTVDPHALLSALDPATSANLAPSAARGVGERFGAGLVVLGNVVEVRDRLRLDATVYDFAGGRPELEVSAEGDASQLFELVDSIAAQILGGLEEGPGARVSRIAAVTTSSLPALRAYLSGDAAFREGRFEASYEAFTRATAADSLFALAHYRRSMAAEWTTRLDIAVTAAEAALRHSARLSERDRTQLEAFLAYRRGAFHDAERLYRTIVGRYPDDVEAWNHLGETLFHHGPLHGRSLEPSRDAFERVLSYDTFRGAALMHLARVAAIGARRAALDSIVAAFLATNPEGDRELELLALQAWAAEDEASRRAVLQRLASATDQIAGFVVWDLATYSKHPRGAMEVAALLTGPEHSPEVRIFGHSIRAFALVGLGRWREARGELERAAAAHPDLALEHRAMLTLFPPIPAPRTELLEIRDALRAVDADAVPPSQNPTGFFNVHDGMHRILTDYLLGLTAARLGAAAEAGRLADRLEATTPPLGMGSLTQDFAWTVRAEVHRAAGRNSEALAAIERVRLEGWYSQMLGSPFLGRGHARFLRAELLTELGRGEEAMARYATLSDSNPHDIMYLGIARLRQARILAGLGRNEEAADHLRRVEVLWEDADPEFRALLAGDPS